ncbi:hypothetical protein PENTCL1PPCAC_25544, partial [Pristionchus entomophagus]
VQEEERDEPIGDAEYHQDDVVARLPLLAHHTLQRRSDCRQAADHRRDARRHAADLQRHELVHRQIADIRAQFDHDGGEHVGDHEGNRARLAAEDEDERAQDAANRSSLEYLVQSSSIH